MILIKLLSIHGQYFQGIWVIGLHVGLVGHAGFQLLERLLIQDFDLHGMAWDHIEVIVGVS